MCYDLNFHWLFCWLIGKGRQLEHFMIHGRMCFCIQNFLPLSFEFIRWIERFSEQILPLTHTDAQCTHQHQCFVCFNLIIFSIKSRYKRAYTRTRRHLFHLKTNVFTLLNRNDFTLSTFCFSFTGLFIRSFSHRQVLNELGLWKKPSNKSNKFTCYNNDSLDRE